MDVSVWNIRGRASDHQMATKFLIYVNHFEDDVAGNILKFADDAKFGIRVQTKQQRHTIQEDEVTR